MKIKIQDEIIGGVYDLVHPIVVGFARNLVEIVPRSFPELFKQFGDQNNSQKQKNENQNLR